MIMTMNTRASNAEDTNNNTHNSDEPTPQEAKAATRRTAFYQPQTTYKILSTADIPTRKILVKIDGISKHPTLRDEEHDERE